MASNVLKTVAHQLGNAVPVWNKCVVQCVYWLHDIAGVNIIDERSTINKSPFFVSSTTHEDSVSNFVQTVLIIMSFIAVLVLSLKLRKKNFVFYILSISIAFVIVCDSIKWTSHMTRYNLPLLVLSSAVAVFFFEKYFEKRRAVIYILIFALTLTAMPYVFRNNFRRLVSAKKQTVFNTSRIDQYFRNDSSLLSPYVEAVNEVVAMNCSEVGLYMGFNFWDYPLGMIFKEKFHKSVRLEHVYISDYTPSDYPLGPFRPCALISVFHNEEEIVLGKERFKKVKDFDKTAVYVHNPDDPIPHQVTPVKFFAL